MSKQVTAEDLVEGRVYRAKKPGVVRGGYVNDRVIIRTLGPQVQYDGPAVAIGRRYPIVSVEKFLEWAGKDVTDEMPEGRWKDWREYVVESALR